MLRMLQISSVIELRSEDDYDNRAYKIVTIFFYLCGAKCLLNDCKNIMENERLFLKTIECSLYEHIVTYIQSHRIQ